MSFSVGGFRFLWLALLLFSAVPCCADVGEVEYWGGSQSLVEMWGFIQAFLNITIELLNVIAALVAFYSAAVIYIKLETGEGEFAKSVSMLAGSIVYFFVMLIVFPSLFAGVYGSSSHGGLFGAIF